MSTSADVEIRARNDEDLDDRSASTDAGVKKLRSKTSGIAFTTLLLLNGPGPEEAVASGSLDGRVLDPWSMLR